MSQNYGTNPSAQGQQASCSSKDRASATEHATNDPSTDSPGFRLSWAQENEVDLSTILATLDELNQGYQRRVIGVTVTSYYNRSSLPTFPGSLSLNRTNEEPPYPRCIQRSITWRRIMSCLEPELRPDYFLTNRPEALIEGYSNVT